MAYCGYKTEEELHEALIGNPIFQRKFMQAGIGKQNSPYTYDLKYATKNYEFTCTHMCSINACKWPCEDCKLRNAYLNAVDEITKGKRKKPERRNLNKGRNKFTMLVNGNVKIIYTL